MSTSRTKTPNKVGPKTRRTTAVAGIGELTEQQRLTVLKHLASGKSVEIVAMIIGLTHAEVFDFASNNGYPNLDKLTRAAADLEQRLHAAAAMLPVREPNPAIEVVVA